MAEVLVTDDELLAWTARNPGVYSAVLPTVDISDRGAVFSAVNRGVRSMAVRSVHAEPGIFERLTDLIGQETGRVPVLAMRQREAQPGTFHGSALSITRTSDGFVCDAVTDNGVHKLWMLGKSELITFLRDMASEFRSGDFGAEEFLGFYPPVSGRFATLAVNSSGIIAAEVEVDASRVPHFELGGVVDDVDQVLVSLFAE